MISSLFSLSLGSPAGWTTYRTPHLTGSRGDGGVEDEEDGLLGVWSEQTVHNLRVPVLVTEDLKLASEVID